MATRLTRSRRSVIEQQEQQSRAKWTAGITKIFADLMVDQVQKGNRLNSYFSKTAWTFMCDEFQRKTGLKWEKERLKNKYAVLRRQFVIVKSLLDQTDFSWDESTGNIIATDEVWAENIREDPDVEAIKRGGCPVYEQLCLIFSEPATNGKHNQSTEAEGGNPSSFSCMEPVNRFQEESSSESEEMEDIVENQDTIDPIAPTTSNRKRGRKGIDEVIAGAILEMASASKQWTTAVKQINARYSIADCIKELDKMQDVDEVVYLAAVDLFDSRDAREIFSSLKGDKRLIWLRCKCGAPTSSLDS
ncbi:L10-interacting MYB domain-containing protein-like isoform X2 [Tripterygium wilfordii]|nr:L10-interacting MYB domain-containing protein-like isoform X2 [Tripterygium wilfordii]